MKIPELPHDEATRLETLHSLNLLDTPHEERFDRLTRIVQRLFGVPIALVSLVDEDRVWFKSTQGFEATEAPREISFCGHVILGNDPFVIPDTTQDERFHDNPLVADDPRIRFYAGCPLTAFDGSKLGTLCIIDMKPRTLDPDDLQVLKDMAAMAESEIAAMELATRDELTNTANRRGFGKQARQALSLCNRQKLPASLIFFDLNKFKPINDTFGHAEGDRALIVFADLIKSVVRDSDHVARVGGDEFVALLTNTPKDSAQVIVKRLEELLAAYNRDSDRGYEIQFAHGVIDYDPIKHPTIDALLADGDALMYERKNAAAKKADG